MIQSLMLTCDLAAETPFTLIGVGFVHGLEFAVYGESDHEAVAFVVHALNLDTADKLESDLVAPTSQGSTCQVLLRVSLPAGRWLLALESISQGVIARRQIEVRDGPH